MTGVAIEENNVQGESRNRSKGERVGDKAVTTVTFSHPLQQAPRSVALLVVDGVELHPNFAFRCISSRRRLRFLTSGRKEVTWHLFCPLRCYSTVPDLFVCLIPFASAPPQALALFD